MSQLSWPSTESNYSFEAAVDEAILPLEFVMTDIVNEYYGPKAVRRISFIAVGLIAYAFVMFYMAMGVPAADFLVWLWCAGWNTGYV